ncbi:hypothetical protein QLQ12_33595 [Actinoplanes sp. NEAU-A12]|uniref:Uncharacterized protein n=1 Tax=Actinoplanes sandaracinus TaxID=3045177 RepID=A0ABT6WUY9_9ACTN|nr:hypothetical protein [Actinoplanes sandaracinus]MDI6103557.1 hypothetical protein [Actinoplanes sandaracinus]
MSLFLAFVIALPVVGASRMAQDEAITTVTVGTAAVVVAFGLLIASILRGRAAVADDEVSLGVMGSSGVLALAAQITGIAGAVVTVTIGLLQRQETELALVIGIVLALCLIAPFIFGNTVRLLSLRFTSGSEMS